MNASVKKILLSLLLIFLLTTTAFATSTVWSWMKDMYNQPSIKPQEAGSIKKFPIGSVTINGVEISTDGEKHQKQTDFSWIASRNNDELAPQNPQKATNQSVARGKYLYTAYCSTCHGADGLAKTTVAIFRGGVLPIATILKDSSITDGYLFYKITYGGIGDISMPPFGYALSKQERWHIINYLNSKWRNK